jgi:hypothetical protein
MIERTRREADKLSTSIEERPVQFKLEEALKKWTEARDRDIASGAHTMGITPHKNDALISGAEIEISEWRSLSIKKPNSENSWKQRIANLEERKRRASTLTADPNFDPKTIDVIQDLIDIAKDKLQEEMDKKKKPTQSNTPSQPSPAKIPTPQASSYVSPSTPTQTHPIGNINSSSSSIDDILKEMATAQEEGRKEKEGNLEDGAGI